jgi:hypothetical protein
LEIALLKPTKGSENGRVLIFYGKSLPLHSALMTMEYKVFNKL